MTVAKQDALPLPSIRFDSAAHEGHARDEAWRSHISAYFDIEVERDTGILHATQHVVNLGEALIGLTEAQSQLFTRSTRLARCEGSDHFLVQVFLAGGGAMPDQRVRPGDMLVIDLARSHVMLNDDFRHVTVVIPRDLDPKLTRILEQLHGHPLSRDNPQVWLLGRHLVAMWEIVPELTRLNAAGTVRGLVQMMSPMLTDEAAALPDIGPEGAAPLRQAIAAFLEDNLHRDVDTGELLSRFRISRATLYRLFANGGGVRSHVRERRLIRAYRQLTADTKGELGIGGLAWSLGFISDSHFSRAFRQHFGLSPRDARAQGVTIVSADDRQDADVMARWLAALSVRTAQRPHQAGAAEARSDQP